MISRRSAIALGEALAAKFTYYYRPYLSHSPYANTELNKPKATINLNDLYDFLFEQNYSAWFCNKLAKEHGYHNPRELKELVMKLHTGETQYQATKDWNQEQREALGQRYLRDLAEDVLNDWSSNQSSANDQRSHIEKLTRSLELDGYLYRDGKLLSPESDVLDTKAEAGVLESLYISLSLDNKETVLHHLSLSEQHYLNERWDDSISNSRKCLESVLREVASAHSSRKHKVALSKNVYERPVEVRKYLEAEGLLESKEVEAIRTVYGLLSNTGGHPYIAQNDQARLLRHLALTFSQFVMLRFQGSLK